MNVALKDGNLVIEIDIPTLCFAATHGPYFDDIVAAADGAECRVTDEQTFAKAIVDELTREEEDGTTLLHIAFDKAAAHAVENGAEGIELPEPKLYRPYRCGMCGEEFFVMHVGDEKPDDTACVNCGSDETELDLPACLPGSGNRT